jgi:hypothetical protein
MKMPRPRRPEHCKDFELFDKGQLDAVCCRALRFELT